MLRSAGSYVAETKEEKQDVRVLGYIRPSASVYISNTGDARWAPVPGASICRRMVHTYIELDSRGRCSSRWFHRERERVLFKAGPARAWA